MTCKALCPHLQSFYQVVSLSDSKLYQIELLRPIPCRRILLAVSIDELILEDFDSRNLIEICEVNLFQVFMILVVVMPFRKFFNRIEHNFRAKSLGESKDA